MKKPNRIDYDAFSWLPLNRWTVDNIMGPRLGQVIFCKICDEYVIITDADKHAAKHVSVRKRQLADDRKKAKELRLENIRRAREEKAAQIAGKTN